MERGYLHCAVSRTALIFAAACAVGNGDGAAVLAETHKGNAATTNYTVESAIMFVETGVPQQCPLLLQLYIG
jgi:hypothetical protein